MKPEQSGPFTLDAYKRNSPLQRWLWRVGDIPLRRGSGRWVARYTLVDDFEKHVPDSHNCKQGGYMDRIKFNKWDKVTQKGYAMIEIDGTYVGGDKDGEPFKTRIFSSQKHLVSPIKDANVGDILGVTFKQNGKFRNAVKITNETADGHPAPTDVGSSASNLAQGNAPVTMGPAHDPRIDAARLATRFYTDARAAKMKPEEIPEAFVEALQLGDVVKDWLEGKGAFAMDQGVGLPSEADLQDVDEAT